MSSNTKIKPLCNDTILDLLSTKRDNLLQQISEIDEEIKRIDQGLLHIISEDLEMAIAQWCYENDIIYLIDVKSLNCGVYSVIELKNDKDAMAFRLKWM